MTGISLALLSALVWGCGDFVGGVATRRGHQFQVLALSALSGVVVLILLAIAFETRPSASTVTWAAAAGFAGACGIVSLYQGLAAGGAAIVAPVAAVVTALIPVLFTAMAEGLPETPQLAGFVAAFVGIWLVTRGQGSERVPASSLKLALAAGTGFGVFLILIARVETGLVFGPLVVARMVMLATAVVFMLTRRVALPSPTSNPVALLAGVLDAGGNVFFVLARQHTRLDVAALLSSLYPVATVALARIVWNERITARQWIGVAVCLASIALVAQ